MMSTDSRMGFVGVMNISDTIFKGKETLKIIDLLVFDRGRGYGSKFIELAKILSKKYYDGGVVLLASTLPIDLIMCFIENKALLQIIKLS